MAEPRFYRSYAESQDGEVGTCFYEVNGNLVTRQVWCFGDQLFWATPTASKNQTHEFTDQPEWDEGDGAIDLVECDRKMFERIWFDSGSPTLS